MHPTPHESAQLTYEWDVTEADPQMSTPLSTTNPARMSRILWDAIMAEGKALDYITGVPGLGGKLRASRRNVTADTPFSGPHVSLTTLAGGEAAIVDLDLIPFESKKLLPQLCTDETFPPTYLVHGLLDTSVAPEESIRTYDQLRELGVPVELSLVEGEGHCFDWQREEEPHIKAVLDKVANFLVHYLG
jgi:acetyl esterase/lipase